ncbi:hypothetical protein BC940DRAFT_291862 [Gongronella butleri]|nr:hypothetical protein BC940DRAFT_291862 [Gongronella butleri]
MVIPQCEQPHLRFVGYRLLARCLELSDDQVRLYALTALLECPFSTMRTAAIGLLKDQVLRQASGDDNGIFVTRLVVDRFLPLIYIIPSEPHAFVEDINHHLQALNFYYFLLQWDKEHNKVKGATRPIARHASNSRVFFKCRHASGTSNNEHG